MVEKVEAETLNGSDLILECEADGPLRELLAADLGSLAPSGIKKVVVLARCSIARVFGRPTGKIPIMKRASIKSECLACSKDRQH